MTMLSRLVAPFLFLSVLLVVACNDEPKPIQQDSITDSPEITRLLAKYKELKEDTLHVYPLLKTDSTYKGASLDSFDIKLFRGDIERGYDHASSRWYAIGQFPIDSFTTALITRVPAMYVSSSIRLFILDRKKSTIQPVTELAELWGDAGDIMIKNSWVFRNREGALSILTHEFNEHDNSIENSNDTSSVVTNRYYLSIVKQTIIDTIRKDDQQLATEYESMLKSGKRWPVN